MKETIDLLGKILTNILTALYEPFGFSLLLSFLAMFFYLYAYEPIHAGKGWKNAIVTWYQKFKESVFFRKLFLLTFVTSMILFRTLLNRNLWMNPLSDVMGGWGIWEIKNGEQVLTTECIENVITMVPFSAVVAWSFEEKIGNGWKKILCYSGKIAFIFSVSIRKLRSEPTEEHLWETVLLYTGVRFKTYSGLPFTYEIRKGRSGEYTKELWIDRREKSKSLAWSSVLLALNDIKKVGEVVNRPKALGDIRGVTYIYGMFYRFGLIDVPDEVKEKMGHPKNRKK